jgi:hypothetical protein
MATEKTYVGKMGELGRLNTAMATNSTELVDLEGTRLKLAGLHSQAQDAFKKQSELRAEKQEATRQLQAIFTESDRLANVVRKALKAHYGIRAEKLVELGVQPFRSRKVKAVTTPELPSPSANSAHPTATAVDSTTK